MFLLFVWTSPIFADDLAYLIKQNKLDTAKPGAAGYEMNAFKSIGTKLSAALQKCTVGNTSKGPFENGFVVDAKGNIQKTAFTKDNMVAQCLEKQLGGVKFPKPPFAPFHIVLGMTVTE